MGQRLESAARGTNEKAIFCIVNLHYSIRSDVQKFECASLTVRNIEVNLERRFFFFFTICLQLQLKRLANMGELTSVFTQ